MHGFLHIFKYFGKNNDLFHRSLETGCKPVLFDMNRSSIVSNCQMATINVLFNFRFDSEYGGRSFGFTSDAESDFIHDDILIDDIDSDIANIHGDVANILERVQIAATDKPLLATAPELKTEPEGGVASHKKSGDEKDNDDPVSSRTDTSENSVTLITTENSVTLVTDTEEPTLTNS